MFFGVEFQVFDVGFRFLVQGLFFGLGLQFCWFRVSVFWFGV